MNLSPLIIDTSIHWLAVSLYIVATVANAIGVVFRKPHGELTGYRFLAAGFLVHTMALGYRWLTSGHGPYMLKYEILSSMGWTTVLLFWVYQRFFPAIRRLSLLVYPAAFLMVAVSLFFNPEARKLPPSLQSIWLVFHVTFYKIAFATIAIGLAFSVALLLRGRCYRILQEKFPDADELDTLAHRFAGFGFIFWAIGMLAGSIWAFQAWGRFWGWDPVETWALVAWAFFGLYLHLRRFYNWQGARAAWLYILCFLLSAVSLFLVPVLDTSVHSVYFK